MSLVSTSNRTDTTDEALYQQRVSIALTNLKKMGRRRFANVVLIIPECHIEPITNKHSNDNHGKDNGKPLKIGRKKIR